MTRVRVGTSREYDVLIGESLLAGCGGLIAGACGGGAAMLVTDDTVNGLYADEAESSLRQAGYAVTRFVFAHGEASKTIDTYYALLRALARARLTRTDIIVALGGGVTGDIAGYAAATYLRGVAFAQIPTTLLAMVDSSVGGKTGVDLPEGKNLAGAFHQPSLVICDTGVLKTLPDEVFRDGCAEMIKHGVILSAELFAMLKEPLEPRIAGIIAQNVSIKRDIVSMDEREGGIRRILNFGHTIGHGIEECSGYQVTHGKAVAIGMVLASRGAARTGVCDDACHREIVEAVRRHRLPENTALPPERLIEAAAVDKKRSGSQIAVILPERIGKCVVKSFGPEEFERFIRLAMKP